MKYLLFALSTILSFPLFAQNNTGTIQYKEIIKMDLSGMEGLDQLPEEIRNKIPSQQELYSVLYFDEKKMLYRNQKKEDQEDNSVEYNDPNADVELHFEMDVQTPDYIRYTDLKSGNVLVSQDLFGRRFLVNEQDGLSKDWKVSTEVKEILGYPCQKASRETADGSIEVWFTPKIPVSVGPKDFCGLPGAVLEAQYEKGTRIIQASKIELAAPESSKFEKPKKGKKVSTEEFDVLKKEKQKEMQEMYGNGRIMIQTIED